MLETKPYNPGEPGPIGWIVAQTPDGLRWVNPQTLKPGAKRISLTRPQEARVKAFTPGAATRRTPAYEAQDSGSLIPGG